MANNVFKNIPSVSELIEMAPLKGLVDRVSHNVVVNEVRGFLDNLRHEIRARTDEFAMPSAQELAERIAAWINTNEHPRLAPVINATGIILHTGLGRAPLAAAAIDAMAAVGSHYVTLEVDAETGQRGNRMRPVKRLLCELTGADDALVVNNNAAATLLTLATLAEGREVIVSRGELIEIGGSYRLPEVMQASGAILRDVGTTNKTRITDYQQAIHDQTAALLRCHTSNYRIVGFTEHPATQELIELAASRRIPFIDDIGSGALVDLSPHGLQDEPLVAQRVRAGADIVLFSGDKLLGGPQCGIILGKSHYIERMARHPLARALRVDKLTLAALVATLEIYRHPTHAMEQIPILNLLDTNLDNLENRARRLAPQIAAAAVIAGAEPIPERAELGGGSVPAQDVPTWCIQVDARDMSVDELARRLRAGAPPIFGRIHQGKLLIDLRTVFPRQDIQLVAAFAALE